MFRLFSVILLSVFIFKNSLSKEIPIDDKPTWDYKNNIPCLEIKGHISNSSKYSKGGINKTIITKNQIDESGAIDLVDILKIIPDINLTQSGPRGQQTSLFLRGTGSNHTLVMINGVPINDQSTTQGAHDFGQDFIQTIHQIEVYPGSSASLFGTNAVGGAINIILTGDYKDSFSFSSDKNNNFELSGNKTFLFDNSSLNVKLGSVKNETISVQGNSSDEKDGVKNYSANVNYENYLTENYKLYNHSYLRETNSEYDNSATNQNGFDSINQMGSFQLGLKNLNEKNKKNYLLFYNIYDREYNEQGTLDIYKSEVIGLKYDLSKIVNSNLSFGLGTEYKYDWGYFENNGSYQASTKGHSENLSIYSNVGLNILEDFNISLFGRNDNHKQSGSNNTYKINLEKILNNTIVGLSYMEGLRNPTLYEMFGTDNYGYSGNKNLKPEKSNTYEIYSNIKLGDNLKISLRAFKSNTKNNIEYISNKYVNDSDDVDLNQSGLNNTIEFKTRNTNLKLFSSILSSKKENGSDQLRRPTKNYGVNYKKKINNNYFGKFDFNILYNHFGKYKDTHSSSFNTITMDNINLIDLKISQKRDSDVFYIKLSNLLDENYQKPHGYNQEGRIIRFGFKF